MGKYEITFHYEGDITYTVEASTPERVRTKAIRQYQAEFDTNLANHINTANIVKIKEEDNNYGRIHKNL